MSDHVTLSESERELIVALLERERSELPAEIRHTRHCEVRDELHRRQGPVGNLLGRLKAPTPT